MTLGAEYDADSVIISHFTGWVSEWWEKSDDEDTVALVDEFYDAAIKAIPSLIRMEVEVDEEGIFELWMIAQNEDGDRFLYGFQYALFEDEDPPPADEADEAMAA